jgi:hypothetical protein
MSRPLGRRITPMVATLALVTSLYGGPSLVAAAEPGVLAPVGAFTPMALSAGSGRTPTHAVQALPFLSVDAGALRAAKLRAAARASIGSRHPAIAAPSAPLVGLFNGINKGGLVDHMVTPPDSTGSIGPANYVEMVNQQVGVYDRSLTLLGSTDLSTFMAAAGWTVSDPQIQWDPQGNRWLYAAVGVASGNNVLLFGWSKTANPTNLTSGWCRFGSGRGRFLDDYPKLGHDDHFLLIGSNVYDDTVPGYGWVTADLWAIPKPASDDASCTTPSSAFHFADGAHVLYNQDGSDAFTPVPTNTADASAVGYVVAAHSPLTTPLGPQTRLMLWHVVTNAGTPGLVTDGEVTVPSFDIPAAAPQPGSSYHLDTLDARLTQAVAHADPAAGGAEGIWTQHTVAGPGGRSIARWYELLPGSPPVLRQQGQVDSATDFVFNAAISPTGSGDGAAIFYNRASSASFPGGRNQLPVIGALSRGATTAVGQMDSGELVIMTSTNVDQDFSCSASTPCRWGDYAGASPDPLNANVVWGTSQFTGACYVLCGWFAQWQTRNFAVEVPSVGPPPPAPPSAPQSLTATGGDGRIDLAWLAPASDGGAAVTSYQVWRGTASGIEALVATLGNVLSYPDLSVTNGQTYYYQVAAANSAGSGLMSNEAVATPQAPPPPPPTPPSAPQSLTAAGGDSRVDLAWLAPASDGGAPVSFYEIWRGTAPGGEALVATVDSVLGYADLGLTNGVTYYYTVRAGNSAGTSSDSNEAAATAAGPPSAPQNLVATRSKGTGIRLAWSAPLSDGGSPITGYLIYRGLAAGAETLYATVGDVTTYRDAAATSRKVRYYYLVYALNVVGQSPPSNEASALGR